MRRTLIATLAVATLLLIACGGDDDDTTGQNADSRADILGTEPERNCAEIEKPGRPTDDVMADIRAGSCANEQGGAELVAWAEYKCADGRAVFSTDTGWGITGETWQAGKYQLGAC